MNLKRYVGSSERRKRRITRRREVREGEDWGKEKRRVSIAKVEDPKPSSILEKGIIISVVAVVLVVQLEVLQFRPIPDV